MSDRFGTRALFEELDGKYFESFRELEQAVLDIFNEHYGEFPPHYTHRDAIAWARRQDWLIPSNGGVRVVVSTSAVA